MCSSRKSSLIGIVSVGSLGILERWSATTFSTLFLSFISKSTSCKRSIHRISLAFASFFCIKSLRVEWLVKIVVLDPSRYWWNFSNANTTTKNFFSVVPSNGAKNLFERSNCIERGFRVNRWCPCADDQNSECIWRFTYSFESPFIAQVMTGRIHKEG